MAGQKMVTESQLELVSQIILKLKTNFPSISVPNKNKENANQEEEESKLIEWTNGLIDLKLEDTIGAIDELLKNPSQKTIKDLIDKPIITLREITSEYQELLRMQTPKIMPPKDQMPVSVRNEFERMGFL